MFVFDLVFIVILLMVYVSRPSLKDRVALIFPKANADVLKCILPLGIIVAHLKISLLSGRSFIASSFLVMSGYGMMSKIDNRAVKGKDVINSVIKIAGPWLFMILVYQFAKFIRLGHIYPCTTVSSFLSEGNLLLLLPYSWFCMALIIYYLITYLSGLVDSKMLKYSVMILIWILLYCFARFVLNWGRIWVKPMYFYIIGSLWYDYIRNIRLKGYHILLLSVLLMVILNLIYTWDSQGVFSKYSIITLAVVALFLVGTQIKSDRYVNLKVFVYLKKYSYWLYLCHGVSLLLINPSRVRRVWPVGIENPYWLVLAQFAITFSLAFVCGNIYNSVSRKILQTTSAISN